MNSSLSHQFPFFSFVHRFLFKHCLEKYSYLKPLTKGETEARVEEGTWPRSGDQSVGQGRGGLSPHLAARPGFSPGLRDLVPAL